LAWSLGEILRWFAQLKTVTYPVLAVAAENRTLGSRVASSTP